MILRLQDLHKAYRRAGARRVALEGVSLEVARGEMVGIFGPAGAGKTTLLRLAAGLEAPDDGWVSYNGERLDRMRPRRRTRYLRREVGCVWSGQQWSEGLSVLEHVALPLLIDGCDHRTAEQMARRLLLACDSADCVDSELAELSDGERQLVAIATALVTEPRVLLVDGAIANLSLLEQNRVMALLSSLANEARLAVVVTGAQAATMPHTDRLFYMRDGSLINGQPASELGQILDFPTAASRRAAANA